MEHLLKTGLHNVAARMQLYCTNLQAISRNDSGNMTAKAKKVSDAFQLYFQRVYFDSLHTIWNAVARVITIIIIDYCMCCFEFVFML